VVAVVGGLWYVAIAVPIGGRTLQERVTTLAEKLFETTPHPPSRHASQTKEPLQDTDQLTDTDRKSLDNLIETKLETTPDKPNAAKTTKR
jgi:hypothetical protein